MRSRDKLRVYLHIGGAKCGSSAIQAYLARNLAALEGRGVGVPGTALDFTSQVTGEQIWYFEDSAASGDLKGISHRFKRLLRDATVGGTEKLVISAENICNHPTLARVLAEALAGIETEVVFYVRRQDDFLISSWQQWNLKRFATIDAYLNARVGKDACWNTMITPWADAFGDSAITVRPFVRAELRNGDVIDDFFALAGISQDGLQPLARNANPSFDDSLARLAHRVRDLFDGPHDNRFYDVMARLLGTDALKKGSASSLLSLEARREILAAYDAENTALKQRFLPASGDDPLFRPPSAENVLDRSETEKLSEDIAMLTRAVYALAAREEGRNA